MRKLEALAVVVLLACTGLGTAQAEESVLDQLQKQAPAADISAPQAKQVVAVGLPLGYPETQAYAGETRTQAITRNAGQDEFSVTLEVPIYKVWTELGLVSETYNELVCRDIPGEGKGNWHGYFNAPSNEKAKRLADAIAGVGPGTAQCVVNSNAFNSKPRTWSDFKSRMKLADDRCKNGIYYRAVVQYGETNAKNLGYVGDQNCRYETRTELVAKPVERRVFSHNARTDITVRVENAPLLPSEQESFNVIFDGFKAIVEPGSRYNAYQVTKYGNSNFLLSGQRKLATPNNSLTVQVYAAANNDVLLRVADSDYRQGLDSPQAQTIAILKVKLKRTLMDKEIAEIRVPLTAGKAEVLINQYVGSNLPSGKQYKIVYSLSRMNSMFNNKSESSDLKSSYYTR